MQFFIKCLFLILFIVPFTSSAQEGEPFLSEYGYYKKGVELFNKEKYAAAQQQFEMVLKHMEKEDREIRANARYFIAISAIELFHEDAEYLLNRFISEYPENPRVNSAYFNMGEFQYRQENYFKAIKWFNEINVDKLSGEREGEFYFKLGYSYYQLVELAKAQQVFYEIKDNHTTYSSPALYYYSHIAYKEGNYQTALEGFEQLVDNSSFSPIMPYYITQIYYLQERFEKVIDYAPKFVQSATAKRLPEIAKIIGDSYYQLQQYDSALTYLEMHRNKGKSMSRQDHYQLGFVTYRLDSLEKAIRNFEKVTDEDDKIAQNAYYHLSDCYLKQDRRNKARLAFEFASKIDEDPRIQENALFNYAKITLQLRNTPFNEAIEAFKDYIKKYPDSENTSQAYNYLVQAYLNSNNYKEALRSLEELEELELSLQKAYQKVAYYRGLELFNNRHYEESIETLDKSLQYKGSNKEIAALCKYWKGESYYQLEKYERAADSYNRFLLSPGAYNTDVYNRAHYHLGYAFFKLEDYPKSIQWLRKFVNMSRSEKNKYLADAYNRIGDAYFIQRSYWQAVDYYDKALALDLRSQDYSIFQRGFALGLLNRPEKKIATLKRLLEQYPESGYLDDAYFEIGKGYMALDQQQNAMSYFTNIINNYPSSSYVRQSLVQLGLIHYNLGNNEKALSYYKRVVTEYPGTEDAKNALTGLKNIYVDMNRVDDYFKYVNSLGDFARVSMNEQDSLTYISAENVYMNEGSEDAIEFFHKYLDKFQNGNFAINAHFYLADCYDRQDNDDQALKHYRYVIDRPQNSFTEQALSAAGQINLATENYRKAIDQLSRLEKIAEVQRNIILSRVGQMRANFILENYQQAYEDADKVLHTEKINDREEREAHFIKAKALFFEEKYDMALKEFRIVASEVNSTEGAEAKYRIAQIYYKKEEYKVAENEIFDFVQQNSSQEYWKAKSYILLADVYKASGDIFQAKHTLKSIIDNYEPSGGDDEIVEMAKEKYNNIVEEEKYKMEEGAIDEDTTEKEIKIRMKEQNSPDTTGESRLYQEPDEEPATKKQE